MGQLAHCAKIPVGIFAFSDSMELIYFRLFSRIPEKAFHEFSESDVKAIKELAKYTVIEDGPAMEEIRSKIREYAISLDFAETNEELNSFLCGFCRAASKKHLEGVIKKDRLVIQAANAYEDMGRAINLFHERLYEWFSLHYPEARNQKDFPNLVEKYGRRDNFPGFKSSTGVDISGEDEEAFTSFASIIVKMTEERNGLEKFIRSSMKEIAPNTSSIIDEMLAARLIALSGSLEKFARMTSSTIQLLGAEKALFRHLHKKGKSPKYGILYTSATIQKAQPDNRGKVARILSAHLMKAARIDFYSGRFEPKIREEMEAELKVIR
jgi:nucleolar protein 56